MSNDEKAPKAAKAPVGTGTRSSATTKSDDPAKIHKTEATSAMRIANSIIMLTLSHPPSTVCIGAMLGVCEIMMGRLVTEADKDIKDKVEEFVNFLVDKRPVKTENATTYIDKMPSRVM